MLRVTRNAFAKTRNLLAIDAIYDIGDYVSRMAWNIEIARIGDCSLVSADVLTIDLPFVVDSCMLKFARIFND